VRPKVGDAFGDLLGSQGYNFCSSKESGPRTMNAMRKEEMAREMDPEKLKVENFTRFQQNTSQNNILLHTHKHRVDPNSSRRVPLNEFC